MAETARGVLRLEELSSSIPSPPVAPNQAQKQPGQLIGIFTGQPFDPLPPSVFGLPDKSDSSRKEIEDMFVRWIKSYGR